MVALLGAYLARKAFTNDIDGRTGDGAFAGYLLSGLFLIGGGSSLFIAVCLNIL